MIVKQRPSPVLFLDFDGVLHPNLPKEDELFCRVPLLSALEEIDVEIVISSSWRFQSSLPELKQLFPPMLARKIVGVTGAALNGKYSRFREIQRYAIHADISENFIALDDSHWWFPPHCRQLIVCDGAIGLTTDVASTTMARLQEMSVSEIGR